MSWSCSHTEGRGAHLSVLWWGALGLPRSYSFFLSSCFRIDCVLVGRLPPRSLFLFCRGGRRINQGGPCLRKLMLAYRSHSKSISLLSYHYSAIFELDALFSDCFDVSNTAGEQSWVERAAFNSKVVACLEFSKVRLAVSDGRTNPFAHTSRRNRL